MISAAGIITVAAGGLPISTTYFAANGVFPPPVSRYVMGALPFYALQLILAMRLRIYTGLVAAVAAAGFAAWPMFPATPAIS